jgi:hypothetical protein
MACRDDDVNPPTGTEPVLPAWSAKRDRSRTDDTHTHIELDDCRGRMLNGTVAVALVWVTFRRWVTNYRDGEFRILGATDSTWDWRRVEVPSAGIGFRRVDAVLSRARECSKPAATVPCTFLPRLPAQP